MRTHIYRDGSTYERFCDLRVAEKFFCNYKFSLFSEQQAVWISLRQKSRYILGSFEILLECVCAEFCAEMPHTNSEPETSTFFNIFSC